MISSEQINSSILIDLDRIFAISIARRNLILNKPDVYSDLIKLRERIHEACKKLLYSQASKEVEAQEQYEIEKFSESAPDIIFDQLQQISVPALIDLAYFETDVLDVIVLEFKDEVVGLLNEIEQLRGFRLADFSVEVDLDSLFVWYSTLCSLPQNTKKGNLNSFQIEGVDQNDGGTIISNLIFDERVPIVVYSKLIDSASLKVYLINEKDGVGLIHQELDQNGEVKNSVVSGSGEVLIDSIDSMDINWYLLTVGQRKYVSKISDIQRILRGLICWDIRFKHQIDGNKDNKTSVDDCISKALKKLQGLNSSVSFERLMKDYHAVTSLVNTYSSDELPWVFSVDVV